MYRRTVGYQPVTYAKTPIRAVSLQEKQNYVPKIITNAGTVRKESKPRPLQSS